MNDSTATLNDDTRDDALTSELKNIRDFVTEALCRSRDAAVAVVDVEELDRDPHVVHDLSAKHRKIRRAIGATRHTLETLRRCLDKKISASAAKAVIQ